MAIGENRAEWGTFERCRAGAWVGGGADRWRDERGPPPAMAWCRSPSTFCGTCRAWETAVGFSALFLKKYVQLWTLRWS